MVGCDGAHSRVRHELGLPFQGHPYPQDWLLADVRLDWGRRDDEVHAFFGADGAALVCFPMRDHRWRLVVPYAGPRDQTPPTLEEIQQLAGQRAPEPIAVSDPTWLASFRCHRRFTNVYRRGRVLLAGDAVHVHSPAGGQGMNTGIMDAHNLGRKLALVAAGRSPDRLLDSYGEERAPVAAEVLGLTHALVRFGTISHPVQRALRDAIVPAAARVTAIQRRAARRLTQVQVAYPPSRLTWPDRGGSGPKPGQRVPDIDVRTRDGSTRLYSVLRRSRHVLLVPGPDPGCAFQAPGQQPYRSVIEVVTVGVDAVRGRARSILLVRPDGYIAARGRPDTMTPVLGYLQASLAKPRRTDLTAGHHRSRRISTGPSPRYGPATPATQAFPRARLRLIEWDRANAQISVDCGNFGRAGLASTGGRRATEQLFGAAPARPRRAAGTDAYRRDPECPYSRVPNDFPSRYGWSWQGLH